MTTKQTKSFLLILMLIGIAGVTTICQVYYPKFLENQEKRQEAYKDIIGDWKEYFIYPDTVQATAVRRFELTEQGDLVQSFQYEYGSQSRIWLNISDVEYKNGRLQIWNEFDGGINKTKDTIYLAYTPKNGNKFNLIFEKLKNDPISEFIDSLKSAKEVDYCYQQPPVISDQLSCASLGDVEVDSLKLIELVNKIKGNYYHDIHSLLVWKDGYLVLEEYFASNGKLSGPVMNNHYRYKPHQLASVTKSINSLAFGIALDNGFIDSIQTPLYTIFPDYSNLFDEQKKKITLEHLLSMSAGLDWNELSISYSNSENDSQIMHNQGDMINYCLVKTVVDQAEKKFNYNSGMSTILGEVIKRTTGIPADQFADEHLFKPLGITNWTWWKDKSDKNKLIGTGGGLSLTSRELLKIGILTLNKGMWDSVQVISKEWINESTKRQISTGDKWYGYQWWMHDFNVNGKTISCYYAMGLYGKFLFVFPELNLIIVSTAENNNSFWSKNVYSFIQKYILPAIEF